MESSRGKRTPVCAPWVQYRRCVVNDPLIALDRNVRICAYSRSFLWISKFALHHMTAPQPVPSSYAAAANTAANENVSAFPAAFGLNARFQYQKQWDHYDSKAGKQQLEEEVIQPPATAEQVRQSRPGSRPGDHLAFLNQISVRYHARRQQHYDTVFRCMMLGMIFVASLVIAAGWHNRIWLGTGLVTLLAGVLVWNVTGKARQHDVLRSQYQSLLDDMQTQKDPSEDMLEMWHQRRQRLQTKEPPVYWAVANDCTYDVARLWGLRPKQRGLPPIWARFLMNWFRF